MGSHSVATVWCGYTLQSVWPTAEFVVFAAGVFSNRAMPPYSREESELARFAKVSKDLRSERLTSDRNRQPVARLCIYGCDIIYSKDNSDCSVFVLYL